MPLSTNLLGSELTDDKLFKELDANLQEAVKVAKGTAASKPGIIIVIDHDG